MIRYAPALALLFVTTLTAQEAPPPKIVGRWDLTVRGSDGRPMPSWLEVHSSGRGVLVGRFVGVFGSVRPISRIMYAGDTLRFSLPPQWENGDSDLQVEGAFAGDTLRGSLTTPDGTRMSWSGVRAPALRRANPAWAPALRLFNGKDLTGWHSVGGTNEWSAVNGVLTNAKGGANLVTDAVFTDFKLHFEVRYPARGNSGVYLRGRHEVQVEDSVVSSAEATGGLGAIYGFLIPNQNAATRAGEWQTLDVTLVGRRVTVVLNGKLIISEAEIPGPTGGALDSNEGAPGPIMLQGDHGPVEYRNLTITPAR
jgi:hypothetical protein